MGANLGTVNEIKSELKTLGICLLIIDPLVGSIEGRVYLRLFNEYIGHSLVIGIRLRLVKTGRVARRPVYK